MAEPEVFEDTQSSSREEMFELVIELDEEDEERIERALESVREGKGIPLDEFLEKLRRV